MSQTAFERFELVRGNKPDPKWDERRFWLHLWAEFLKAAKGPSLTLDFAQVVKAGDEAAANNENPTIFLMQTMTGIGLKDELLSSVDLLDTDRLKEQISLPEGTMVTLYDNISVVYERTETHESFVASGFIGSLDSKDAKAHKHYVDMVADEYMKAAIILAQNAKAAGWTQVNFGRTKDPAKIYALQVACASLGLECGTLDPDDSLIRKDTAYASGGANRMMSAYDTVLKSPMLKPTYKSHSL
jgi:hypothetical protein